MGWTLCGRKTTALYQPWLWVYRLSRPGGDPARDHRDRAGLMNNSVKKLNKAAMTGVFKSDKVDFKLSKYL